MSQTKRKKAETKTKTVAQLVYTCKTLRNTRYCKACMGKCEYDDEPTFLGRWVSEVEYTKSMEEYGKQNEALAKVCYDQQVNISELQTEVEQLKAVRDALGISNKKALEDRNTFIKKAEGFEGENAKLLKRIEKLYRLNAEIHTERSNLRERLEAIRKHYEKLPTWKEARQKSTATNKVEEEQIPAHLILIDMWNAWARERGVLLSEPKSEAETK